MCRTRTHWPFYIFEIIIITEPENKNKTKWDENKNKYKCELGNFFIAF